MILFEQSHTMMQLMGMAFTMANQEEKDAQIGEGGTS